MEGKVGREAGVGRFAPAAAPPTNVTGEFVRAGKQGSSAVNEGCHGSSDEQDRIAEIQRSSPVSFSRSPAAAYLSVRKLLEEVEFHQHSDKQPRALSQPSGNLSANSGDTHRLSALPRDLLGSEPQTRADGGQPRCRTWGLPRSSDAAPQSGATARALRRVHWLAQWTLLLLEAYPLTEDSDAETTERASFLFECPAAEEDPATTTTRTGVAREGTTQLHGHGGAASLSAASPTPTAFCAVALDGDEKKVGAVAPSSQHEAKRQTALRDGSTTAAVEKMEGIAGVCDLPTTRPAQLPPAYTTTDDSALLSVKISTAGEEVRRQSEVCATAGVFSLLAIHDNTRNDHKTEGATSPSKAGSDLFNNNNNTAFAAESAHRPAASASLLNASEAPPPMIPRDRPQLCREVGAAYTTPSDVEAQRAVLLRQHRRCAHCGAALAFPSLSFSVWCATTAAAVRRAVFRCCCCCSRGGGERSRASGCRRHCCSCFRCFTCRHDNGSQDGEEEDQRGTRAGDSPASRDGTNSVDEESESGASYIDGEEEGEDGTASANEQEGLLAQHRHHSHGHARQRHHAGYRVSPSPPPPPPYPSSLSSSTQSFTPLNVSRRLKLTSSASQSNTAVRENCTAAAAANADNGDDASSPVVREVPGAHFCVYEGVYLCTTCFDASAGPTFADVQRSTTRFVETEEWQRREHGSSAHNNMLLDGSGGNHYSEDAADVDSALSPVRTAVSHAADCLHQWWMSRRLAEEEASSSAPPPPLAMPLPSSSFSSSSCAVATATAHDASARVPAPRQQIRTPHMCLVPAHVLLQWDFTRYPVSARAAALLLQPSHLSSSVSSQAPSRRDARRATNNAVAGGGVVSVPVLYDISAIHPALYTRVPALAAASQLRKRMCLLHAQAWWCRRYRAEVWGVDREAAKSTTTTATRSSAVKAPTLTNERTQAVRSQHEPPLQQPPQHQVSAVPPRQGNSDEASPEEEEEAEKREEMEEAARWRAATPSPPRCAPRRRYLVERAEGWSLQDLHRLTTPQITPAVSAATSQLSEKAGLTTTKTVTTGAAAANMSAVLDRTSPADMPLLLVELRAMYAVLQQHVNDCDYCRMHCRGAATIHE